MAGKRIDRAMLSAIRIIQIEATACRRAESQLLAKDSVITANWTEKVKTEWQKLPVGPDRPPKPDLGEGAFERHPPGMVLRDLSRDGPHVDEYTLRQSRRDLRNMLSGLNRLGAMIAFAGVPTGLIVMTEGRYFAAVWQRWWHYVVYRRQSEGRHRIYALAEHLVHEVARHSLKDSGPAETSAGQIAYWNDVLDQTHSIEYYYPKLREQ